MYKYVSFYIPALQLYTATTFTKDTLKKKSLNLMPHRKKYLHFNTGKVTR